jgi:phage terminase large subunit-like protein
VHADPQKEWLRTARPDQLLPEGDWRVVYYQGGRGAGKLLDVATPIPTPRGWAKLGEINAGDEVFDEAGRICRVTATFDDIPKVAYRLRFSDGTFIDACSDHQWVTWTHAERKEFLRSPYDDSSRLPDDWPAWRRRRPLPGGNNYLTRQQVEPALALRAGGATVDQVIRQTGLSRTGLIRHLTAGAYVERKTEPLVFPDSPGPRIRTTQQIADTLTFGARGDTNHSVPVCGALDLPEAGLPVHPYVLGCWLGDGSSVNATLTSADPEILDHIRACGETVKPLRPNGDRCPGYLIGGQAYARDPAGLTGRLRKLGVIGSKHVPSEYLRASASQRLALLQGLMDTDGSADARRCAVEFTSTCKPLADAVVELARSLGQKPVCAEGRATLYGRDCGPKWRVTWRPTIPVFRLSRKLARCKMPTAQAFRHYHRMIVSAERIDPVAMRCLTVDSPHHMYLAGESMVPTHNTRSSAQGLAQLIQDTPEPADWAIVAPTYRDAWTVCVEGESGFLAALGTSAGEVKNGTSRTVAYAHRSYGEIGLRSGHVIYVDSANDGALRVQGKNLTACWCSEIGLWLKWATAWDESIAYAVRKGISRIIADGTPKISRPAAKLIRRLLRDEPGVVVRRLRTADNLANLSETFYRSVVARATGTRLERQELEGELLDDVENALWSRDLLESIQVPEVPGGADGRLHQVTVGADPSDGTEDSDECAYTVAGIGGDRRLYVPESWGGRIGAVPFLKRVVRVAERWDGRVILEKNHGGAYLEATLRQVMRDLGVSVPYQVVHASQAKRTRAEPVAALYERDIVRHVNGPHVELEDQCVTFTGAAGERSPDRLDSLVWAITPFLDHDFDLSGTPRAAGARRYALQAELDELSRPSDPRHRRATQQQQGTDYGQRDNGWGVDSFAPQDDDGRPSRPNVHSWR